ncbi:hypothetical protein P280DRAFT_22955 [Massarina eburnea CBS 473.64]|uniref:BTB domain-containing protein n=1 Tax=Massarina eburnea CBS 473.64 TaxID=1395130 RepID=A0A6A6RXM9_9PLEO|nr:hypothetical protein P280DRAFT_22955 [Massarina eburnea CBS 473.64]
MSANHKSPPSNDMHDEKDLYLHEKLNISDPGATKVETNSQTSPYADTEIICLEVGTRRFYIHRSILSQSSILDANPTVKPWAENSHNTITLPDLDETCVHVLVHYLYTGTYQPFPSSTTLSQFRLAISVYAIAIRTSLPSLSSLAKTQVQTLGLSLPIFDILREARDHAFPLLSAGEEEWLPSYIDQAIKKAATLDPELFTRPAFTDQIEGNRRFRQVVMQAIVNTYTTGTQPPQSYNSNNNNNSNTATETIPVNVNIQDPSNPKSLESAPNPKIQIPNTVQKLPESTILPNSSHPPTLDKPVPSPKTNNTLDPFTTQELGFEKSNTKEDIDRNVNTATGGHTRADSVVQSEPFLVSPRKEMASAGVEGADTAAVVGVVADGGNGETAVSKKSKSKKKNKKGKAQGSE